MAAALKEALTRQNFERFANLLGSSAAPAISLVSQNDHQLLSLILRVLLDCGPHSTGVNCPVVLQIDCCEVRETRHIYDRILNGLAGWPLRFSAVSRGVANWNGSRPGAFGQFASQDTSSLLAVRSESARGVIGDHVNASFPAFSASLSALLESRPLLRKTLILMHAERLQFLSEGRASDRCNLIASLLGLVQDASTNLAVVFITDGPSALSTSLGAVTTLPSQLEMPPFEHEELLRLLLLYYAGQRGHTVKLPLQTAFEPDWGVERRAEMQRMLAYSLADQVGQSASRSLTTPDVVRAMSDLCNSVWDSWIAPVERGSIQYSEIGRLANAIKEPLRSHLEQINSFPVQKVGLSGKVALLSSYLACYKPSRADARLFGTSSTSHAKKSKRHRTSRKEGQSNGPKAVAIDRVYAIFEALMDQVRTLTGERRMIFLGGCDADFCSQMAMLAGANLLIRTASDRLDSVKIRVAIERGEAGLLAENLGLSLANWGTF